MNLQALFVLCLAVLPAPSHAATQEGLVAARSKNLDELHLRPNADLAGYRKVLIDPVQVEFAKDWLAHMNAYNRSPSRWITPDEARRIAEESAASLQTAVTEAFKARGYEIVATPGPGVLRLSPSATELFVNAPDGLSPWRTRTFTREAGDAKLLLEARDAETGTLLARVFHRGIAREVGRLNLANEVSNRFWFDALFSRWAANCADEFAGGKSGR
jgi:uncharacterized protein DUF3313